MNECTATIKEIRRDDMRISSCRIICAILTTGNNEEIKVYWASSPAIRTSNGGIISRRLSEFERAWNEAKVGQNVILKNDYGEDYYFIV